MPVQLHLPQFTLLISPLIYTALFHLLTISRSRESAQLTLAREILSLLHCTLITLLSLLALYYHASSIYPPLEIFTHLEVLHDSNADGVLPIIATKSSAMNSLLALETSYLLADTLILLRISRAYHRSSSRALNPTATNGFVSQSISSTRKPTITINTEDDDPESNADPVAPGLSTSISTPNHHYIINDDDPRRRLKQDLHPTSPPQHLKPPPSPPSTPKLKLPTLLTHHILLLPPLLLLQLYIIHSRERGILILTSFLLMNASSPLSSVRWWLVNFQPGQRGKIAVVSWTYWGVYGVCRVWLFWWVLRVYGAQGQRQRQKQVQGQRIEYLTAGEDIGRPFGTLREDMSVSVSVWRVFPGLRWPCRLGTGALWGVNVWWFGRGVWKMIWRGLGSRSGKGSLGGGGRVDGRGTDNMDVDSDGRKSK